jgi:hypothetical protein
MAFTLINSASAASSGGGTFSTTGFDTTGATAIYAMVASYAGATAPTLTDSKGNTWQARTEYSGGSTVRIRLYDCLSSPTVGSGHTITLTGAGAFGAAALLAYSGSGAISFVAENGATNGVASTASSGSVDPAGNNRLMLTGLCVGDSHTISVSGGSLSTLHTHNFSGGNNMGFGVGHEIQTAGASRTATWSFTNPNWGAANIAAYTDGSGGGGTARNTPFLRFF